MAYIPLQPPENPNYFLIPNELIVRIRLAVAVGKKEARAIVPIVDGETKKDYLYAEDAPPNLHYRSDLDARNYQRIYHATWD